MNFIRVTVKNGHVNIGGNDLDLKPRLGSKLSAYEGKELVFGFRPEAIVLHKDEKAYPMKSTVELTEMLGDNTNVYINIGDEKAILKVDPHDTPELDTEFDFFLPYEGVYLFDGETEKVIK